jgi:hypothetical protein
MNMHAYHSEQQDNVHFCYQELKYSLKVDQVKTIFCQKYIDQGKSWNAIYIAYPKITNPKKEAIGDSYKNYHSSQLQDKIW